MINLPVDLSRLLTKYVHLCHCIRIQDACRLLFVVLQLHGVNYRPTLGVCGSTISATRPVPVADDATRTCTRPAPKIYPYPTRPAGIPVPVTYPYEYCECRQVDVSRLLGGKLTSSDVEKIDLSRL